MNPPSIDAPAETWLVWADHLQEAGDFRGQLITLNQAVADGADPAERDRFAEAHRSEWLGAAPADRVAVTWALGLRCTITAYVDPADDPAATVIAVLAAPVAEFAVGLRVVARTPRTSDRVDLGSAIASLARCLPATCHHLDLVDERAANARVMVSTDYEPGPNLVSFGRIADALAIPAVTSACVVTADAHQLDLSGIEAPQLEGFELRCLRWAPEWMDAPSPLDQALADARWPGLRRLALRLPETFTYSWPSNHGAYVPVDRYDEDNDDYGYDDDGYGDGTNWVASLEPLLTSLQSVPLERLSLTSFAAAGSLIEALTTHGLPETLRELDLSDSSLETRDLAALARVEVFGQLAVLDLRGTFVEDASELSGLRAEVLVERGQGRRYEFSVGME